MIGWKFLHLNLNEDNDTANCASRCLFVRRHRGPKKDEAENQFILFVANIPRHFEFNDVMEVFKPFGAVDSVDFTTDDQSNTRNAKVTMESVEDITNFLKMDLTNVRQPFIKGSRITGKDKWRTAYKQSRPDCMKLQKQVDRFMELFDEREMKEKLANSQKQVDEDGFTLVTDHKPKRKMLKLNDDDHQKEHSNKKKRKTGVFDDFYRFQALDEKKAKLTILREKFEQDRQRFEKMRANRTFRPF